jgi:hypothetical protein
MPRAYLAALLIPALLTAADPPHTRNIVLVTADGLRWQDLFHGIDPLLVREKSVDMDPSSKDADDRRRYATRETLAPFFWTTIANNGSSSPTLASPTSTTSPTLAIPKSLPDAPRMTLSKATILSSSRTKLSSNFSGANSPSPPHASPSSPVGTLFHYIAEHTPGSIFINAGYQDSPSSPDLSRLQHGLIEGDVEHAGRR